MKYILTSAPLALLLFFGVAFSTQAQTHADFVYDAYVSKHFDQTLAIALDVDADVSAASETNTTAADAGLNVTGSGTASTDSETTTSSADMDGDGGVSASFGEPLIMTRSSLGASGDLGVRAEGERLLESSASVASRADLEAYASSRISSNENIEGAEFSSDRMRVSFKEEGRLFGFVPVSMTSHAEVNADGSVEVTRPWYRFMVATSASADQDLEARLTAALEASAESMTSASGNASLSAAAQARLLDEIVASLDTGAQASATGSTGY